MSYEGEEPIEHNGKKVVAFLESGEWTIPEGVESVDVLVVGGGGAGGWISSRGGGGGAGELVFKPSYELPSTSSISITVGSGGTADSENNISENGGDSIFDNITAIGGGSGGRYTDSSSEDGQTGGSGGGARGSSSSSGSGGSSNASEGFGNSGGNNSTSGSSRPAAGGGGAGEPGQNASSGESGNGGNGLYEVEIDSITYNFKDLFGDANTGEEISNEFWYAGGGGGSSGGDSSSSNGSGGNGGGGDGTSSSNVESSYGMNNTGGGAGGNINEGGSGIVILAYEDPFVPPTDPTELEPQLEFEKFTFTGSSLDFDLEPMVQAGSTVTTINGVIQTSNEGVIQTK